MDQKVYKRYCYANDGSYLANVHYPAGSSRTQGSNGTKFFASHKLGGFDYTKPCASSSDISSTIYSAGATTGLDEYALPPIDSMGLRYDHVLSFPGQVTSFLVCDTYPITQAFCDEDHMQFFDTGLHSQNLGLEPSSDLQSAVDNIFLARSTAVAQMRWTKLFSLLKWFSIRRIVAYRRKKRGLVISEIQ